MLDTGLDCVPTTSAESQVFFAYVSDHLKDSLPMHLINQKIQRTHKVINNLANPQKNLEK